MRDDPLTALEVELVGAARRRAVPAAASARTPAAGSFTARRRAQLRWRPALGHIGLAAAVLVAVLVAIGAVALIGANNRRVAPAATQATGTATASIGPSSFPARRSISALNYMSRKAPNDNLRFNSIVAQLGLNGYRSAGSTNGNPLMVPGGATITLWDVEAHSSGRPSVDLIAAVAGGRVIARGPSAAVVARGLIGVYGYSSTGVRLVVVVPNKVARVKLSVPGHASLTAIVHHNLATYLVRGQRLVQPIATSYTTWYGRSGKVLRIASPANQ
jgi:hypothetical protein